MRLLLTLPFLLAGCGTTDGDWRGQARVAAEEALRTETGVNALSFSAVQVTGDAATGQTCGRAFAPGVSGPTGAPARFIVFIDNSAGPWIEGGSGHHPVSQAIFDYNWQDQCVALGYSG